MVEEAEQLELDIRDAEVILDHARSLEHRILELQGARDYRVEIEDPELFRAALRD